ncbi:two-component response regulator [Rhodobacteraceae bacterium THAF1]|uniref:response regulator n=1 Tax=Palleronia sp. THAF1 TaxID=2587842 RepID=UPI000F3BAECB|nr:response regulator [Palleronia sp. THAF1]QFU09886.1 two-component response regulator [Palleronia sp. THAF1]VDC17211.1 two-component response regulator [Rhodobacteraceae bacterium THAF1]
MLQETTLKSSMTENGSLSGTVVIVEDDRVIAEDLRSMCEEAGMRVLELIGRPHKAAERIAALSPSHVLMDIQLGGREDGVDIALNVRRTDARAKVIFVTASADERNMARIMKNGPLPVLVKPISEGQLRAALAG